jgi:hypothetical protein
MRDGLQRVHGFYGPLRSVPSSMAPLSIMGELRGLRPWAQHSAIF